MHSSVLLYVTDTRLVDFGRKWADLRTDPFQKFSTFIVLHWVSRYTKNFSQTLRGGESGFLGHTRFERGKISNFA